MQCVFVTLSVCVSLREILRLSLPEQVNNCWCQYLIRDKFHSKWRKIESSQNFARAKCVCMLLVLSSVAGLKTDSCRCGDGKVMRLGRTEFNVAHFGVVFRGGRRIRLQLLPVALFCSGIRCCASGQLLDCELLVFRHDEWCCCSRSSEKEDADEIEMRLRTMRDSTLCDAMLLLDSVQ